MRSFLSKIQDWAIVKINSIAETIKILIRGNNPTRGEILKMNKPKLIDLAKNLNLPSCGKKYEIIDRLMKHFNYDGENLKHGYIYLIKISENRVKIGRTKYRESEEKVLAYLFHRYQTPLGKLIEIKCFYVPDQYSFEKYIHEHFSYCRIEGTEIFTENYGIILNFF